MRCNACWRELESHAISTTCGHIFCKEDANKILNSDGACPVCDQVLSKRFLLLSKEICKKDPKLCPNCKKVHTFLMRPVEINPGDEWINMSMAGISPQILMKSAYRSVRFYIDQKELEGHYKMNKMVAQYRKKCESMQAKFTEKMQEVKIEYQKIAKKCQLMEKEIESLTKDKQELQDKYAEKSRQKTKLDEMYDQLRTEFESSKRAAAIQPEKGTFGRDEPDLFHRQDGCNLIPETPGRIEEAWVPPVRDNSSFNISIGSAARKTPINNPIPTGFRPGSGNNPFPAGFRPGSRNNPNPNRFRPGSGNSPVDNRFIPGSRNSPTIPNGFGSGSGNSANPNGFGSGSRNPVDTLKNLLYSPKNLPNQSRPRNNFF